MSTGNEIRINTGQRLEALDLDPATTILPSFRTNDRSDVASIDSDFSQEFEVPGTAHNHRLLSHAVGSQSQTSQAYQQLPCLVFSEGVETMPRAILYLKGYAAGRIKLQLVSGNKRFTQQLRNADGSDKKLADLDFSRFDHKWEAAEILARLPYAYFQQHGVGYEVFDRGKILDLGAVNPYDLYPSVAANLVFAQIVAEAGFTSDSLTKEVLFKQLAIPSANPFAFSQDFRDARGLVAGYAFRNATTDPTYYHHREAFGEEQLIFSYVAESPYHAPEAGTGAIYANGAYTVATLGYYNISASINTLLEINSNSIRGKIRCKFQLKVNGQLFYDSPTTNGHDELETGETVTHTFNPKLSRVLLKPGDEISLWWNGDELGLASGTHWRIGATGARAPLGTDYTLSTENKFTVELLPDFPIGGTVKLQEWLPDLTQLEFVKVFMLLGSLTFSVEPYTDHLHIAPGYALLSSVDKARNWSNKLDAEARPGRQPERELAFRYGPFGQANNLKWAEDAQVTKGYGNGVLRIADELLPLSYDLATLPFAATELSPTYPALLRIRNFKLEDAAATPPTYSTIEAKPRLVLRSADTILSGSLILTPQQGQPGASNYKPAVLVPFETTTSFFAGTAVSLELNSTVLTYFWQDFRALMDRTRHVKERLRLSALDICQLRFDIPVWLESHNDFFALLQVSEFSSRRGTECELLRLSGKYLPPPAVPAGAGVEFWGGEFWTGEFL